MASPRNFWPLGIVLAFALFFSGMIVVIIIAVTHRDSLVSANYYEQEMKFQGQIDSAARAQQAGATLTHDAATGQLTIKVPLAQLTNHFSGTVELYRPSAAQLDQKFPLEPRADGTQTLDVSQLASGLWLAKVQWTAGGESYFLEQKITIAGK